MRSAKRKGYAGWRLGVQSNDVNASVSKSNTTRISPGGHLLFRTPCIGEQGRFLRVLIPVLRACGHAPFVNFVTEKSLLGDVTRAGFDIQETGLYPKKSHSLFIAARKPA